MRCPACGSKELTPSDSRGRQSCLNCHHRTGDDKVNPPIRIREPDRHDIPLTERLRYLRVGRTINVNADDLRRHTIYSLYLCPTGVFGPGQWTKIAKERKKPKRDFCLKLTERATILYFSVRPDDPNKTGITTFYGLSEAKPVWVRKCLRRWIGKPNARKKAGNHGTDQPDDQQPAGVPSAEQNRRHVIELAASRRAERRGRASVRLDGTLTPPTSHEGDHTTLPHSGTLRDLDRHGYSEFAPVTIIELTKRDANPKLYEVHSGESHPVHTLQHEYPHLLLGTEHPTRTGELLVKFTTSRKGYERPKVWYVSCHYSLPKAP